MLPSWIESIHHDGSEKYAAPSHPALGERVRLRIRMTASAPVSEIYLRTFPDGEGMYTPLEKIAPTPGTQWWEVDLPVQEPVVRYLFLLASDHGVFWYSAAGPSAHPPAAAFDFRLLAGYHPPDWLAGAVFYQIFPDRFANGDPGNDPAPEDYVYRGRRPQTYPWGTPPAEGHFVPLVFYGGDLAGIQQRLDYIESLGVNALYLNPIFTARSNHKYDVVDYHHVDPQLGGDASLAALRAALTARGMRYLLDIVPNHCGYWHPWFQKARREPNATEAGFFTFRDHPDDYATWLGVRALPKLNYESFELRSRMYGDEQAVLRRWLRTPYAADGWRVDVANMLARQGKSQLGRQIASEIRQAVKDTRPQAYLLGENFFEASDQLQGDQWDGAMNYAGFTFPLWHWLRGFQSGAWGMAEPIRSPVSWPTSSLEAAWRERRAAIPWAVAQGQYNLLDSHDTERIRSVVGGNDALQRLALVVQLTYPGVPGLYYGDEIGMSDTPGLGARGCMIWEEGRWDQSLLAFYRQMITLRRESPVLQRGGFQMLAVEADSFAYQRESSAGRILVVAQRGERPRPASPIPAWKGGIADGTTFHEHASGARAVVKDGLLPIPEQPQGASLWIGEK